MKTFVDIINEMTTTADVPAIATALPDGIVSRWKKTLDYDKEMKNKFSYFDVAFKTPRVPVGHKGHLTRSQNELKKSIEEAGLDVNETLKSLYRLYPPQHF